MKMNLRELRGWILAAAVTFAAGSGAYAQGTWTTLAPLTVPTEGLAIGGVGNVIVSAYGYTAGDNNPPASFPTLNWLVLTNIAYDRENESPQPRNAALNIQERRDVNCA